MYQEERINSPEEMQRLKEKAKNRPPLKVIEISPEAQEDIDKVNSDFRRYLDVWYAGGDLKKVDYLNLVLQLRAVEALEKRKEK